jgi:hypothetical protein
VRREAKAESLRWGRLSGTCARKGRARRVRVRARRMIFFIMGGMGLMGLMGRGNS